MLCGIHFKKCERWEDISNIKRFVTDNGYTFKHGIRLNEDGIYVPQRKKKDLIGLVMRIEDVG